MKALEVIGAEGSGDEFGIGHQDSFSVIEIAKMFWRSGADARKSSREQTSG